MEEDQQVSKVVAIVAAIMNTTEAAAYLGGLKPSTLEQWRWNGKGPKFIKMNRSVKYRKADLDAFIDERIYGSTTAAQAAQ